MIDSGQLRSLVMELVRNASEAAARKGKSESEVLIHAHQVGDSLALRVENSFLFSELEETIKADALASLFQPFIRGKSITPASSGLGLPVAWAIVERFGGTIELRVSKSETAEEGTFEVLVSLPTSAPKTLGTGESESKGSISDSSSKNEEASSEPASFSMVIVEDEASVAGAIEKIVGFYLKGRAQANIKIFSGLDACDYIIEEEPDLILCDFNLRNGNAESLATKLNEKPELLKKLFIMSGNLEAPAVKKFTKSFSCPLLKKPFDAEDLTGIVDSCLRKASS